MANHQSQWADALKLLVALAARLEGEGQYNLAKLSRAAAESLTRQAAFQIKLPSDKDKVADEIERAVDALSRLGADESLLVALTRGSSIMRDGKLPLIHETPHAYVCRTCGHLTLGAPPEKCLTCAARGQTFQWFPPVYWLEALDPPAALARLRQTPLEVAALIEDLSDDQMAHQPTDGGWAIRNIVSHLRDAQGVLAYRIDLFLEQENPVLESKAVFAWATNEAERPPSTREIFETYQASRSEVLAKLESLPLADWWRTGRHEEFGVVSIKQQVSYFAAHEVTHLPQIDSLRKQLKTNN